MEKQYFYDHAGRLIAEETSSTFYESAATTERIVFLYDESGIIGMRRTLNGTTSYYYFKRNLLGDVTAIYNSSGVMVAKYLYDAYGNCTYSGTTSIALANPIRYRGYYYDDETGLYYLNARYYSPMWRRFISPDDSAYLTHESINGLNLYCYCNNDPINYVDPSGHSAKKFYLFGYEWRKSAGWKSAPTIIAGPVGRIGFSSYVTRKKKRSGVLYGFAGATSDVTSFLDTTYYAGVGVNLFGILGAEVQLETFGIGAMVSIGDFSISLSVNLLASTSITFAVDTDLGDDCTQTTGFTVGINTVGLLIAAAYAYFLIINGLAVPSPVPSPAL